MSVRRICVIGAGPSGMSVLYHYNKLKEQGKYMPDIVCYDKQPDWGGQWLFSSMTGVDQYGEPVHGSMYKGMWTNNPKEVIEYPDYTFQDHFKKPIPSFFPRKVMFHYLKGRWSQNDLRQWIHFSHVVRSVTYNNDTDDFSVVVKNLPEDKVLQAQRFDYVIVASGHFSVPNIPHFEGIKSFPGPIIHSHDFKDASEFKDHIILIVGGQKSAEDIAIQTFKYGAKKIFISYRTKPIGHKWPSEIEERPLLTKIEGKTVHFQDHSSVDVDSIILCTGYKHHFPFMEERLRLKTDNILYPPGLYKGVVWYHDGNNRVMYIGMQNQSCKSIMFDVQAKWVVHYISGDIIIPHEKAVLADMTKWAQRAKDSYHTLTGEYDFRTDYVKNLADEVSYGHDVDCTKIMSHKQRCVQNNPLLYRDSCYVSTFSGVKSIRHHTTFMKTFDDSLENFLNEK